MSPIILLSLILQIACCVHIVRTRRPLYWILVVLVSSFLGMLIYFIAEVLPGLGNTPGSRRVMRRVKNTLDPQRDMRAASRRLDLADTPENRRRLAEESLQIGDFAHAREQYQTALTGLYATDPDLMLGLAQAQFGLGESQPARETLEALIAANPNYRSSDGHLLYARTVEACGTLAEALHEYETVARGYPGEEARARYALLLRRNGEHDKAREVFQEILTRTEVSPKYYRRGQRDWIEIARRELATLR